MKITLDLETNVITVPKNFFESFAKQNEMIERMGGTPIKPIEVIKASFATAIENTDKYLITRK